MLFRIIINCLLFITISCSTTITSNKKEDNKNTSSDTSDSVDKDSVTDPNDESINLTSKSWTFLQSKVPSSTRTSRERKILVSDDNTIYVSFRQLNTFYVYKWNNKQWIQIATSVEVDGSTSFVLYNNIPYIAYKYNDRGVIKKLDNNQWIDIDPDNASISDVMYLSLSSGNNNLYLMYIDKNDHKLHVQYLKNDSWTDLGDIPNDTYGASSNNGIQMAFYNNNPYIALIDRQTRDPRILCLKNNKWQKISSSVIMNDYKAHSDYSFVIDSKGTFYFSYVQGNVAPLGKFEIIKFQNGTWTEHKPFVNKQIYGNQMILINDELYIAYSESIIEGFVNTPGFVRLSKINSDSMSLENVNNSHISGDVKGSHVSLIYKNNRIYSFYLDLNAQAYVVKGALIK